MKYGFNLLLWTAGVTEEHRPLLEMLKKQGYDGVELPIFELNPDHMAKVGKWLDDLGLERTAVTCRGVDDNPASPDAKVRAAGVANNKLVLDCCQAAGATIIAGPYHSALGYFTGSGPTADERKWAVESMRQVAEHAAKVNVRLAVEYLNRFECYLLNSAVDTAAFCKEVNHPSCRMMYDTFHANIEEKSAAEAIKACKDYTIHVHISENNRGTPGKGHVPWDATYKALKKAKYDGWLTIEAFGRSMPALAAATRVWRDFAPTPDEVYKLGFRNMKQGWARA